MKNISFIVFILVANFASAQIKNVNKVVDSCISKRNFNGVVLIAKNGKVDYLKYTGIANRHYDIKFSDKTRFQIFSVTKTFTAVLIMQLYEQGKINLDATISTYYPEYKGEAAKKATIRNLLTYSSGRDTKEMQPKYIPEAYDQNLWPVDTFINRYCSEKLIDTPGTKFNYSNGDFIILGRIIEKIYNKSFEDVLREKILRPLKMNNTDYLHHEDIIKNLDEGYYNKEGSVDSLIMPTNHYMDNHFSAGAMYSTAQDLLIFDQAIFNHTILKKATVDLMLTPYKQLGDVAFGFWVYPKKIGKENTLFAERQGGGYGHNSNWVHLIDKDITLILLSNTETADLNKMRVDVLGAYLDR
ncbi:serine hydrolase domain-containing protein [Mucilaginibacter sabulilitoris]|uniref:Serine hydrolase domain-containing protein n=1 Tax=Mucilaginibacter sabulilitoris TaxID=1173583 RepID=A0ABZ0TLQ1_9SPHI|nr:serine hydrolase domain-containing protein [Mucilaginibacter sabulilitoris]WPU94095.1 serine hydrolase domain-containing protein [Mucilaginibacter sabulilitoris]